MRGCAAFPVDRRHFNRQTLQEAQVILAQGLSMTMFPESTRSKDARLHRGFRGTALIACRANVPVLPVGITGTEQIRGLAWIFRRPLITVTIGKPFRLSQSSDLPDKEELERQTEDIMRHIAALLPAKYRGVYGEDQP